MKVIFDRSMTFVYLTAASILLLMALFIMVWSVVEVYDHIIKAANLHGSFISTMLQSVGAIVIAVAILDVAKYMIEEEVLRHKELRSQREARETLTKILVIVAIAVSIEGLVYIFKAGAEDIRLLIYPGFLIVVAVLLVIGLGVFQHLSIKAEKTEQGK